MNPISRDAPRLPQDSEDAAERLRSFMKAHDVGLEDLAKLLRTPPQTLEDWFKDGVSPPASLLALMLLLETMPQAWGLFGIRPRPEPAGGGVPDRSRPEATLTDEEALRRARAI